MRPTTLLDASVLYPSLIRNLLMHLATAGLIGARWTDVIHDEWTRNLLADRPDLSPKRLERTRRLMEEAVPDARVTGYEPLIPALALPDPDDRHVLAAAITAQAELVVTWNIRHFPTGQLQPHGLEAVTPDDLFCRLLSGTPEKTREAVEELRSSLRSPSYTWSELLARFDRVGLIKAARNLTYPV